MQAEEIETDRVLLVDGKLLFWLTLGSLGLGGHLLLVALVAIFFDGCPYGGALVVAGVVLVNASAVLFFLDAYRSRQMLVSFFYFLV